MTTTIVSSILRHVLGAAGGGVLLSGDEINRLIGAVMVIISIGWSVAQKIQAQQQATR